MSTILQKSFILPALLLLAACNNSSESPSSDISEISKINRLSINLENTEMEVGELQQLTLSAIRDDGKEETLTQDIVWSVDKYNAVINETTGKLEAKHPSVVEVKAVYKQIIAEKQVTINPSSLESINLEQISSTASICQETQLIAMGIYADGSTKDISKYVRWDVEGKDQFETINVRKMNEVFTSKFLMSSQFTGPVKITATFNYDYLYPQNSIVASKDIDITDDISSFEIESIDRNKSTALGRKEFIRTQTTYNDGSIEFGSAPVWSSSNPTVAKASNYNGTQNNAGLIATFAEGTATITAECGMHQASTGITVTAVELDSIELIVPTEDLLPGSNRGDIVLNIGDSIQLTATGTYTDRATLDITDAVVWSEDAPWNQSSLIRVDANGGITAEHPGESFVKIVSNENPTLTVGLYVQVKNN